MDSLTRGKLFVPCATNENIISDFLTRSFNCSGDVEKGFVAKKGLPSGNLNENSPHGRNFKTLGAYFGGYFNKSFNDPSVRDFGRLFGFSLMSIFATSAIFLFVPLKFNDISFVLANAVLGVILFPVLTRATGIFTFTVPLTLFSLFYLLPLVQYGREKSETWNLAGRGALIVFCLFCFLYFYLCRQLFFTTGYCFLMGMLPAAVPSIFFAKLIKQSDNKLLPVAGFIISFSVFFWTSSLVMLLRVAR